MGQYGISTNGGGLVAILRGGAVGEDCSRFYMGWNPSSVEWSNVQTGLIAGRVGHGNLWLMRHWKFWPVSDDVYVQASGYLTGCQIGDGNTFVYNNMTYANPTYAANLLANGDAFSSSLNCTVGGSVSLHLFDSRTNVTIDAAMYNAVCPLHIGGENPEYVATPEVHYRVKRWTLNGNEVAGRGVNALSAMLPGAVAAIACEFEVFEWRVTAKVDLAKAGHLDKPQTSKWMAEGASTGLVTAAVDDEVNYRFKGWYRGYGDNLSAEACTELVQVAAVLDIVAGTQDVTYVAKFVSRKTSVSVSVSGSGTFDAVLNGNAVATGERAYANADAREGWSLRLTAKPAPRYYFSHWLAPLGEMSTQNIDVSDFSTVLMARASNDFMAYLTEKTVCPMFCTVSGVGQGSYSGDLSAGGVFTGDFTTADMYIETEYAFVATDIDRLYTFEKWQYRVGETWTDIVEGAFPGWVRQVSGRDLVVYVKGADATNTHGLRAVFRKLLTYSVAEPLVEGSHPITKALAVASGSGCMVSGLPAPDETVGGVARWIEGTDIEVRATAGVKWVCSHIQVTTVSESKAYPGETASFKLTEGVLGIVAVFEARQYRVSVVAEASSAAVGHVVFVYTDITGSLVTTDEPTDVYVDTDVVVKALVADELTSLVAFYDWWLNGVRAVDFTAEQRVKVVGTCAFSARFSVDVVFSVMGSVTENGVVYPYGKATLSYEADGAKQSDAVPLADGGEMVTRRLVCGTLLSFRAEALSVTTAAGVSYQGYFQGWFEQDAVIKVWGKLDGWGLSVADVALLAPRILQARFSRENRWPRLKLHHPDDGRFCAFSVGGVRSERSQEVGGEVVVLTDANEWFCDPFSIVQVRIDLYDSSSRFLRWLEYDYASGVEKGVYSEQRDFSVFMTGDLFLKPVFWTGTPILAEVAFADGCGQMMGDVSIEGDSVRTEGEAKAWFVQNDGAVFVASPRNGYRFDGWYSDASGKTRVSSDARYEVTMEITRKFYAKFAQDRNAIYTFGTSKRPKTFLWRSRRVVLEAPTHFSSILVDAEGYGGLQLTVYHASSPEVPYKVHTYLVSDGNSRRLLPGARGEKAFEFELSSSHSVNALTVGTSVSGLLAQGGA